ncbi:TIGR04348 family glycosyltransferase [Marinobacter sp. 71-i]|uniref:TIGR04348 family glycosyltransferase n=1 Tax=Marinobacter iranensis TaxID=2962607 RepID=A0ABT5Y976_9GAMM|nr:selenoneine biosynthesis selenosugar synthase SenB [Marinobacter iranensis]MDF0750204.1 TIGR04348 family glycosyltransferase [Marinobacter iranensis]
MKIALITPAPPGSKAGNRATAERWSGLLQQAGHQVSLLTEYTDEPCDLFIALHAWRSHEAVTRFRHLHPETPLIVVLTGTDIYDHQYRYPEQTHNSMEVADCLVGLHHRVGRDIPERFADKLVTVLQSADKPVNGTDDRKNTFDICVIGHLRQEKDPLRAALAARLLPDTSAIRVFNAGKAHTPDWEQQALAEQEANPRFKWLGELDKPAIHRLMHSSRAMVISSLMEGGANVVSEACRAGLPVIASDISGNLGLLGDNYPGYFRVGDEADLARVLQQAEQSSRFLGELHNRVRELARLFTPEAEQAALLATIEKALAGRARLSPGA